MHLLLLLLLLLLRFYRGKDV